MTGTRILVAEDDLASRTLLVETLNESGFLTAEAGDGVTAVRTARERVDLAILDLGLPGIDGIGVIRTLRGEGCTTPIIVVSGRQSELDRVLCFELGADDYVSKPYFAREVICRIRALLRRSGDDDRPPPAAPLTFARLVIDEAAREARVDGRRVELRPKELSLLSILARNAGIALSRKTLIERAWGFDYEGDDRTVDGHIRRIRQKLEEQCDLEPCIATIYGFGYKFVPPM